MMAPSNVVCGTPISSCDYGSSVCHACRVSQLATESSTLEQRRCHWHTILSRHENCRCAWLVSVQPFGTVTIRQWPSISASRNPYFPCWPQHWVSIVWLWNIWLKHATLWFCPLFCGDVQLSLSCWRKNREWGCGEGNISTGEGVSKWRPEKFNNKEIFCPPLEILVVW